MKKIILFLSVTSLIAVTLPATFAQNHLVHNVDVLRFWEAYDQIIEIKDTARQIQIIRESYIKKGTPGLKAIMEKRGYTAESYIHAINAYPKFWQSIRANTLKSNRYALDIEKNIEKFKSLYPECKESEVFFTIGVLRTGGTAHKGCVLIGSEIAMADSTTITVEIEPAWLRENLAKHFQNNPIDDVVLLNIHEYVHTQQGDYGNDLLSMSIFEGVAEFLSVLATGKPSPAPAISFGYQNENAVRDRFQKEMFSPNWNDWLYNDFSNEFGVRDLGYYVGYAICEKYYHQAKDRKKAIKDMIELDCADQKEVMAFVEKSDYLAKSYELIRKDYDAHRPTVIGLKEIRNNSITVDPKLDQLTIQFSSKMSNRFRNFKLGTLGKEKVLKFNDMEWSEDGKSLILAIDLKPNERYQLVVDSEFRDTEGRALEKYTIDFKTSGTQ